MTTNKSPLRVGVGGPVGSGKTALLELLCKALRERYELLEPLQRRATWHRLFGILAALVALLVNSISVTYFIGTSRWCQ